MVAGLEPLVAFWTGWGIHFMVLLSFTVQVTLLLLADLRRRRDWVWLKVVIWSAYMLADTAAIYALGHMAVVCRSPEHQLLALWAPLLLVHLGGQDNITAYAIEDNQLWLRHLQNFGVQVAAAGYVLYVSNILFHPSELRWAAILIFGVGLLKYGERIWALKCANSYCSSSSSSLSAATSYSELSWLSSALLENPYVLLTKAYSLLDVPKQMFQGPTTYVQVQRVNNDLLDVPKQMFQGLRLVGMQLSMMYDLLYTKAAVVHTWYGLSSRVLISLPFTITALALLLSHLSSMSHGDKDAAAAAGGHKRSSEDVLVTSVLLVGAVVLEIMSVLGAIFSRWTVLLLLGKEWHYIGYTLFSVIAVVSRAIERLTARSGSPWSGLGRMRQHSLFKLVSHSYYSRGRKMAKWMGVEDWWDSNAYSWSTEVPPAFIKAVLELVESPIGQDILRSQDWNALQQRWNALQQRWRIDHGFPPLWAKVASACWQVTGMLKLEETILVLHIATHAYIQWCINDKGGHAYSYRWQQQDEAAAAAAEAVANYMFFLLAARPNILPYPVSRQAYVQLCSYAATHLRHCTRGTLLSAIQKQKTALREGTPLQPDEDEGIVGQRQAGNGGETGAAAQPQPSVNITLDRGCQLAANLIHLTETEHHSYESIVLEALLKMWTRMLCYTAYWCNENSHAKHLTDGGEIMNAITLLMIYKKTDRTIRRQPFEV